MYLSAWVANMSKIRFSIPWSNLRYPYPVCKNIGVCFSRTPAWDFRCFYPSEIILSHILVPACGKDKKYSHVAYQIKGNEAYNNILANILLLFLPLTPGVGSKG